nr:hypothetical protein [uncultured Albidiferax sp.]
MPQYQAFTNFTAQSKSVSALMSMYSMLEKGQTAGIPLAPVVVFLAFSIESYLNSLGSRAIPFWDEIEKLSWKSKINLLHKDAERKPDWGDGPLQFATEVFRLRDKLAHGKPERVVGPKLTEEPDSIEMLVTQALQPDWYKGITLDWVLEAKERFRLLMVYLSSLYGLSADDHLHSAHGGVLVHDDP